MKIVSPQIQKDQKKYKIPPSQIIIKLLKKIENQIKAIRDKRHITYRKQG